MTFQEFKDSRTPTLAKPIHFTKVEKKELSASKGLTRYMDWVSFLGLPRANRASYNGQISRLCYGVWGLTRLPLPEEREPFSQGYQTALQHLAYINTLPAEEQQDKRESCKLVEPDSTDLMSVEYHAGADFDKKKARAEWRKGYLQAFQGPLM